MKPTDADIEMKLVNIQRSSKKRGLDFNLRKRHLKRIMSADVCAYSGEEFGDHQEECLSLERVDPRKGYVRGNVIAVKKRYNSARSDDITAQDTRDRMAGLLEKQERRAKQIDIEETAKTTHLSEIETLEEQIAKGKRMIEQAEARLPSIKTKLNAVNQQLTNLKSNQGSSQQYIDAMAVVADAIERHEQERAKTVFSRIKRYFLG